MLNSNNNGIALVELLIIVILISTLVTASWNIYSSRNNGLSATGEFSLLDSVAAGILDEIAFNLRQARLEPRNSTAPVVIRHESNSDEIEILINGEKVVYFINDRHLLVRERNSEKGLLLSDVNSLKAVRLGSKTLLLTVSIRPGGDFGDYHYSLRNYSKVITVNSLQ
jgi:hypothetical protein